MKRLRFLLSCWLLLLFVVSFTHVPAGAYLTENLVIVSIDGIRDLEAFEYEFLPEEEVHPYIPFIWNELKPLGVAYLEMYNICCTFTSPGHMNILTGTWQVFPNLLTGAERVQQARAWAPTIFEYARKELELPASECYCVVGKSNCLECDYSIHPNYGESYGATMVQEPAHGVLPADSMTTDEVLDVMDTVQPSILFVNLQDVDPTGHTAMWGLYTGAIRIADRCIQRIWEKIQTDPFYAGNTTLIVTTDHGRHSPGYGDFQNHSGMCKGCKHIMCLLVGPDTPADAEVTRRVYHTDFAPTIGELLDFTTPYSTGQVLREAVSGYDEPERFMAKNPAAAVYNNMVCVTWSDNRTGIDEVYFAVSENYGSTWADTLRLSSSGSAAILPDIAMDRTGVHVVWLDYRADRWEVYYRKSEDFGFTWEPEELLFSSRMEDENGEGHVMLWEPFIGAEVGGCVITASAHPLTIGAMISMDGGDSWDLEIIDQNCLFPRNTNCCRLGKRLGITWCDQASYWGDRYNWEVFFKRSESYGYDWLTWRRLSFDESYSIQPNMDSDGLKRTAVAWADNLSGIFQIFYRRSDNVGVTWDWGEIISSSPAGAWQPDIGWDRKNGEVNVVWTDFRNGNGELYHTVYDRAWSEETAFSSTDGSAGNPDLAFDSKGNSFLVWEEVRDTEISLGMCNCLR